MNTNSIEIISVYVNLRKVSKQLRKKNKKQQQPSDISFNGSNSLHKLILI